MISSKLSIVDLRNFKLVKNIYCTSLLRRAANVLYKIVAYQEYSNSVIEKKKFADNSFRSYFSKSF